MNIEVFINDKEVFVSYCERISIIFVVVRGKFSFLFDTCNLSGSLLFHVCLISV